MGRYYFNKNFIPRSFVERKRHKENEHNRRSVCLLALMVIALMPSTVEFIGNKFSDKKEFIKLSDEETKKNSRNDESFFWWMDIIKNDTVGTFNNVDATIDVESMDKFYELLKNKDIEVRSVEQLDDAKIKIQISKYSKE